MLREVYIFTLNLLARRRGTRRSLAPSRMSDAAVPDAGGRGAASWTTSTTGSCSCNTAEDVEVVRQRGGAACRQSDAKEEAVVVLRRGGLRKQ